MTTSRNPTLSGAQEKRPGDCTLAVLYPAPERSQYLSQLKHRYMFGETLLVVEQVQSFLERCSHLDLALVSASVVGQPEGQAAILGALVAALTMARHERVVVIQGQTLAKGETEIEIDRICRTLATEEVDVVLPPSGSFCPGGYRRSCSRALERALQRGRHAPAAALKGLRLFKLG